MPTETLKAPQTRKDNAQQSDHARHWVESREGQRTIVTSLKQAQTMTTEFSEAQRIKPESLYKPVTL